MCVWNYVAQQKGTQTFRNSKQKKYQNESGRLEGKKEAQQGDFTSSSSDIHINSTKSADISEEALRRKKLVTVVVTYAVFYIITRVKQERLFQTL